MTTAAQQTARWPSSPMTCSNPLKPGSKTALEALNTARIEFVRSVAPCGPDAEPSTTDQVRDAQDR
jgi:hypothetical protein